MNIIQSHIEQAERNEELHAVLKINEPDRFFNWRIVALYYGALHYLKALASKKNIVIGETHSQIESSCNPDRPSPKMPLNRDAWLQYQNLQKCAKESRNDLAADQVKRDYEYCLQELDGFKKYIKTQGIQLKG